MVISEARLAGRSKGLICGIVSASVIVLVVSALVSGIVLPGLLMAAGIVAFTWAIVRMTVSIAIAEEKILRWLWKRRPADGSPQPPIPKRWHQKSRIKLLPESHHKARSRVWNIGG
jgi:hypothetical protein